MRSYLCISSAGLVTLLALFALSITIPDCLNSGDWIGFFSVPIIAVTVTTLLLLVRNYANVKKAV